MSDFSEKTGHVARKAHTCFGCGDAIEKGERYYRWRGTFDGSFFSSAEHPDCTDVYGELDMDGEGVSEGYALDFAYEVSHSTLDVADQRQDGEAARAFVTRMLTLHRAREAARKALKAVSP